MRKQERRETMKKEDRVNNFFERSRASGNSYLEEQLKNARTEKERKRIRRLLKDFS